ncbi:hypothetical protein CDCA_CDCA17G4329 [Cyanidium caldarium]|uniref:Syntaxin binding protein n=1 Tax=Cyanidium caldarium TaxID=2771 RepID=A0AAV9J1C7_CYACA|nr:hypothetical protein CDCA_CDCA17G4329 [Cyanidium caldarium]
MGNALCGRSGIPTRDAVPTAALRELEDAFPWARLDWLRKQLAAADGDVELASERVRRAMTMPSVAPAPRETSRPTVGADVRAAPETPTPQAARANTPSASGMLMVGTTYPEMRAGRHRRSAFSLRAVTRARLLHGIRNAAYALGGVPYREEIAASASAADEHLSPMSSPTETRVRRNASLRRRRRSRPPSVTRRGGRGDDNGGEGARNELDSSGSTVGPMCTLVLDRATLPVTSAVCRMHHLLDCNVLSVELVHRRSRRSKKLTTSAGSPVEDDAEREEAMPRIFFLSPSKHALDAFVESALPVPPGAAPLTRGGNTETSLAVLLSGHLDERDMVRLRRQAQASTLFSRIACFAEIFVDHVAIEERLFHMNHESALLELFPAPDDVDGAKQRAAGLRQEARQLASVCLTLSSGGSLLPSACRVHSVQYVRGTGIVAGEERSPRAAEAPSVAGDLAQALIAELEALTADVLVRAQRGSEDAAATASAPLVDVLIVDRTVDVASLFVHDFHYQAMAMDLLSYDRLGDQPDASLASCSRFRFARAPPPCGSVGDAPLAMEVDFDEENDALWRRLRHAHIADAVDALSAELDEYLVRNPPVSDALARHQRGGNNAAAVGHGGRGSAVEGAWRELRCIHAEVPEWHSDIEALDAHFALVETLLSLFSTLQLDSVASIEQDLACCRTSKGRRFRHAYSRVQKVLEDPQVRREDKLRVALLYLATQEIGADDMERLLRHFRTIADAPGVSEDEATPDAETHARESGMSLNGLALERAWAFLHQRLAVALRKDRALRRERRERSRSRSRSRLRRDSVDSDAETGDDNAFEETSDDYELSRYSNRLAVILRQWAEGALRPEAVTSPVLANAGRTASWAPGADGGLNGNGAKPISPSSSVSPTPKAARGTTAEPEHIVVVYVAGGITPSEVKDVYRFSERLNVCAVAGGSCVLTAPGAIRLMVSAPGSVNMSSSSSSSSSSNSNTPLTRRPRTRDDPGSNGSSRRRYRPSLSRSRAFRA